MERGLYLRLSDSDNKCMKRFILLLICCCVLTHNLFTQALYKKPEVKEVKALYNTYIVEKLSNGKMYIYNKTDSLRFIDPNYLDNPKLPKLSDYYTLKKITKKYIAAELIRQEITPPTDDYEDLSVGLIADMTGRIREMSVSFPQRWNISIIVVEAYMTAVLNSGLTYEYDPKDYALRFANWIGNGATYSYKRLMEL